MIDGINHVGYRTDDLAAAAAFLRATLGAEPVEELTGDDGARYAFLRLGAAVIELIEPADRAGLSGRMGLILDHVALGVGDLDAALRMLAARGVAAASDGPATAPDGLRYVTLDAGATLGATLQLVQPAPRPGG